MKYLVIIPARSGSKGLPGKNIRELDGKPLIGYSIEVAKQLFDKDSIVVSSDGKEILDVAKSFGLNIPFVRPDELAQDHSTSAEVLLHCIEFFKAQNKHYDAIVLLQPTSPLREKKDVENALTVFENNYPNLDMVVSVKETDSNPYYVLYEENSKGFLEKSKPSNFTRRQDCPKVWEVNGAVYVINTKSLQDKKMSDFQSIIHSPMSKINSVDIDDLHDFEYVEFLLSKRKC